MSFDLLTVGIAVVEVEFNWNSKQIYFLNNVKEI